MSTAPIPALAPVIRTVLPRNLDTLKTDMDERELNSEGSDDGFPRAAVILISKTLSQYGRAAEGSSGPSQPPYNDHVWIWSS